MSLTFNHLRLYHLVLIDVNLLMCVCVCVSGCNNQCVYLLCSMSVLGLLEQTIHTHVFQIIEFVSACNVIWITSLFQCTGFYYFFVVFNGHDSLSLYSMLLLSLFFFFFSQIIFLVFYKKQKNVGLEICFKMMQPFSSIEFLPRSANRK